MGSDGGDVGSAGGVPPSGFLEDSREVRSASWGGGMGVVIGGGGIGGGRDVVYEGTHLEAAV